MLVASSGVDPLHDIIVIATGQNLIVVHLIDVKARTLSGVGGENFVKNVSDNRRSLSENSIHRIAITDILSRSDTKTLSFCIIQECGYNGACTNVFGCCSLVTSIPAR